MPSPKLHVYLKETGELQYSRVFEDNETYPRCCDATTIAPQRWRMEQNNEQAFFRNGQWEYEPIPEDEQEDVEADQ